MPPYILFLTGSYKSECRAWEIERLVRKMLLSLLTATIPVSYSPALQMLVVSGILIVSMALHYHFMPYKVSWTVPVCGLVFGFNPLRKRTPATLWHGLLADSKRTYLQ